MEISVFEMHDHTKPPPPTGHLWWRNREGGDVHCHAGEDG